MDTIYEMISWFKYLGTLSDTFERYNTNSIGKKLLLFLILFICVVLLVIITPFLMVGSLLRLVFIFIDWVNEALDDTTIFRYALDCTAFLNFFLAIFVLYGILYVLYLLHRLLAYILGKTITEKAENIELNYRETSFGKESIKKEEPNIYVINEENY